jgi:hypothetical protein
MMCTSPRVAITMNQIAMVGPNIVPTRAVPRRWMEKRAIRTAAVTGTTNGSKLSVATFRPSTADNTEMAGVMMPSPKSRPAGQHQGEAEPTQQRSPRGPPLRLRGRAGRTLDEREEREGASLALVVGAKDQEDVLEGDREGQNPENEAGCANSVLRGVGNRVRPKEDLRDRVQRARADVAVDDPEGGQAECREATKVAVGGR